MELLFPIHIISQLIDNTTLSHVGRGIFSLKSFDIYMFCTTISNFSKSGIILLETPNTILANAMIGVTNNAGSMGQSGVNGIIIELSQYAVISSTAVMHVEQCGIFIMSSQYVAVSSTVAMYAQVAGICIESSQYTTLSSAVVMYAEHVGMLLSTSNYTDIVNATVSHSGLYGVLMSFVHHATVINTSVTASFHIGIFVAYSTDVASFNTSVMYSGTKKCVDKVQMVLDYSISCFGLHFVFVDRGVLHRIQVTYAEDRGIGITSSSSITVKNATVTHNNEGVYLSMSSNIDISFTTISNFSKSGVRVSKTQYSVISNVKIVFIPLQIVAVHMFDSHGIEIESIFMVPNSQVESHEQDNAFEILYCSNVSILKSVFSNIDNPFLHQTLIGNPTVFLLFFSRNIYFSDCTFEGNNVTGLLLLRSHFTIFGTLNFTGNMQCIQRRSNGIFNWKYTETFTEWHYLFCGQLCFFQRRCNLC